VKILLIRLRSIGDVIQTTPAIAALRRHAPAARISYLVEDAAAPVVATHPDLDELIAVPRVRGLRRIREDWSLSRRLRAARFDTVLDFHGGPRASLLTWLSGAPVRIGYDVPGRGWMYTTRVARPRELRARHSVENQWDLLTALDPALGAPQRDRDPVRMPEDPTAAARIDALLARLGVTPGRPLVVVHVSAASPFRRYPHESFVELVVRLAQADAARRVIVKSGPSEQDAADRIITAARARLGDGAASLVACPDVTLPELRSLIGRAALFVGGDSGPLNIAATTQTPIVGIYGPTLPVRAAPWRSPALVAEAAEVADLPCRPCHQQVCAPGDFRCLQWLAPAAVADAAERALARAAAGAGAGVPRLKVHQ
jgi:lipopolysaccharide heptosyltransferase II